MTKLNIIFFSFPKDFSYGTKCSLKKEEKNHSYIIWVNGMIFRLEF